MDTHTHTHTHTHITYTCGKPCVRAHTPRTHATTPPKTRLNPTHQPRHVDAMRLRNNSHGMSRLRGLPPRTSKVCVCVCVCVCVRVCVCTSSDSESSSLDSSFFFGGGAFLAPFFCGFTSCQRQPYIVSTQPTVYTPHRPLRFAGARKNHGWRRRQRSNKPLTRCSDARSAGTAPLMLRPRHKTSWKQRQEAHLVRLRLALV